jgi:hypothetical protein
VSNAYPMAELHSQGRLLFFITPAKHYLCQVMNRREFFKITGLGAGSLFLASAVLAAPWTEEWEAEEAVKFAVELAREHGAEYVDARIGPCDVIGNRGPEASVHLLQSDLLGVRVYSPQGWRVFVMRDWSMEAIRENLPLALKPATQTLEPHPQAWVTAQFCKEKVLAHHTTDSTTDSQLNMAWLRFAQRPSLPPDSPHFRFCDILLHQ